MKLQKIKKPHNVSYEAFPKNRDEIYLAVNT